MRVLHVEDRISWFNDTVRPVLTKFCDVVDHAVNFNEATKMLDDNEYDYIIVDQSIPIDDSSSLPDISNGIRFADHVRNTSPGMPILILTGEDDNEATEKYLDDQELVTFWDGQQRGLIKVRPKYKLVAALSLIKTAATELRNVENIVLEITGSITLTKYQKRVIKIFAKQYNAFAAKVEILGGGLSSSTVLRVTLINSSLQEIQHALAKLDRESEVKKDVSNYLNHIQRLPVGSAPILLGRYFAGCADIQGAFYRFASDYSTDYFDALIKDHSRTKKALEDVFQILGSWEQAKTVTNIELRELRNRICSDEKFSKLKDIFPSVDFDDLEKKTIKVYQSIQHGDLHGKNILLTDTGNKAILIDYGDVKEASSLLDIVTLELSPYFHPNVAYNFIKETDYFDDWFDDDLYIKNSFFPEIASFLRQKKQTLAILNMGYVATVYAYALRQLTYDDTDHQAAIALVNAAIKKLTL
ncbi:hypothetical protein CYL31_19900 [Marinomonas sp. A3A]|uniref:hypothetical protein n=1 Tax=Marinomonas sp. A3A TaxID=2065312 RepID=UPI001BB3B145|nr:hypothetical protein [Marinomonas sp. A3A]QUX93529.1 hypothetical protein CYL31_19900 [Marinomonas sp. A3A]